ncbi:hypothetical protein C8T65DRAFT_538776, partial [Cerioporus squamosus]
NHLAAQQPVSSSHHASSSTHSRDGDVINPVHTLAFPGGKQSPAQEVHIVKVTDNTVKLETGPMPESMIHRVGASLVSAVPT